MAHYRCAFEAIPAKTVFRPPLITPKPRVNGILTALVDGQKDKYAYIDDEGRYKVKLFFDPSEEKDGKASKAIRLAQPYAGPGYGMHFPLHTGTEIAVGFVDGDLDRPIGLGAVPNPGKGSPVKAAQQVPEHDQSHSGNSVTLEDKEGKTGVHIKTTGGHSLGLDDDADTKGHPVKTSGRPCPGPGRQEQEHRPQDHGRQRAKLDDQGQSITLSTTGKQQPGHEGRRATSSPSRTAPGNISLTIEGDAGKVRSSTPTGDMLKVGPSSLTMKMDGTIELRART